MVRSANIGAFLSLLLALQSLASGQEAKTERIEPARSSASQQKSTTGIVKSSVASSARRGQPMNLLNDNSLAGWTNAAQKPANQKNGWSVKDGVLHRGKKRGGDLYHEQWFRDFELTVEWKISAGGNSGIKYRVQQYGKQRLGCEYQIQDDKGKDFDKHATGSLYAVYSPSKNKVPVKPLEWNRTKIVVCGNSVEHWLNDQLVVAAKIGSLDWLQRVDKSKFRDKPFFGQNREGRIFLQDHGNEVWFRNIVVTPLDFDER